MNRTHNGNFIAKAPRIINLNNADLFPSND